MQARRLGHLRPPDGRGRCQHLIEVGPGQVLSGLIKRISDDAQVLKLEDVMKGASAGA